MKKILFFMLLALSFSGFAQKIKLVSGSLTSLKGEKSINTEFTYNDMKVGKYDKEADYVNKKKGEYNEKEAGKGDSWAKAWEDDRNEKFEPQFRELFAKNAEMSTVDEKAKYTMIVHTTFTETGYNIGISSMPAYINLEVIISESANKSNVIATITVTKSPGRQAMGFDFETGVRLQEAYAKAGKELGQFIESKMGK
jgi:uncharacterized protein with NAD-binding domain and iron-sulfur cluster